MFLTLFLSAMDPGTAAGGGKGKGKEKEEGLFSHRMSWRFHLFGDK